MCATVEESEKLASLSPPHPNPPSFDCAIPSSGTVMFSFPVGSRLPRDSLQRKEVWKLNQSAALPRGFLMFAEETGEEDPGEASQASANTAAV